jgi:hypothetical protein
MNSCTARGVNPDRNRTRAMRKDSGGAFVRITLNDEPRVPASIFHKNKTEIPRPARIIALIASELSDRITTLG